MISIRSILVFLIVSTISVHGAAVGKNCGSASNVISLTSFKLTPDPVKLPAVAELELVCNLLQDMAHPIQTVVTLEKKVLFMWIKAPCENGVGSCTYPAWCDLCKTCSCPLKAGTHSMKMTMNMTSAVPTGEYRAEINFRSATGQTGCVSITGIQVN